MSRTVIGGLIAAGTSLAMAIVLLTGHGSRAINVGIAVVGIIIGSAIARSN